MAPLSASIVITTRNRRSDVLVAIESCVCQDYPDTEVLVIDDASDDDTVAAIRQQWPSVRIVEVSARAGLIANRTRGFSEASGELVFSIDDDAYFSSAGIVSAIAALFAADDSIGAVAIPYLEPAHRLSMSTQAGLTARPVVIAPGANLRAYTGCSHAVRRRLALALGGYRDYFVHQGEERDFCLRLLDSGSRIVYGRSAFVVHMVSPNRDAARISYYGARNQILFDALNLPFPEAFFRVVWDAISTLRYRFAWASLPIKLRGLAAGLSDALRRIAERRPVSRLTYRRFRSLPNHGPEPWEGPVPPPCTWCPSPARRRDDVGVTS